MGFTLFSTATGLTGLIVAATAITPHPFAQVQALEVPVAAPKALAQATGSYRPVGCRITRDQIGVYQEPNVTEAALGVLAEEITVTLGTGSGNGWARIVDPKTGWVQAKFLRGDGATPCPASQAPVAPTPPSTISSSETAPGGSTSSPTTPGAVGQVSRAVCAVLPEGGLIVRDQPDLVNSRVIGSIRPGNYTFQFTSARKEVGEPKRQWAYITAPAKGWVSTGIVGGGSNLSGEGCS